MNIRSQTIGALVIAIAFFVQGLPNSFAETIRVPTDFGTIQGAIDNAVDGDTILVGDGTYTENLLINNKSVFLISESGPDVTIIDGGASGSVIDIFGGGASNTVVSGFTIQNGFRGNFDLGGAGILIRASSPTITQNLITNNNQGHGFL